MSLYVESINVTNKELQNVVFHSERFNRTRRELFHIKKELSLQEIIKIPEDLDDSCYKCRLVYDREIVDIHFEPYVFRRIESFKIVHDNNIDYTYKTTNRDRLKELFEQRGDCDDIIIIKNGFVTDAFSANILFYDGVSWFTPDTPLLKGTMREKLLEQGLINARRIKEQHIPLFMSVMTINAMLPFNISRMVPVKNLKYHV